MKINIFALVLNITVMKNCYLLVGLFVMLLLGSCGEPATKEAYLEKYEAFVVGVEKSFDEFNEKDWEKAAEEYEKFAGEWYNKFKDEFTSKENIKLAALKVRYNACCALNKTASGLKQLFESIDVNKIKKQIQHYIENDMDDDLDKLIDEAKKAGSEAEKAVNKILKDLDVEPKDVKGKMEKLEI